MRLEVTTGSGEAEKNGKKKHPGSESNSITIIPQKRPGEGKV